SVRNPRRRPRQGDGESPGTAPQRKKTRITGDVRANSHGSEVNGYSSVPNGRRIESQRNFSETPELQELAVRGKKTVGGKRAAKSDDAMTLVSNNLYSIRALPSTPKELRQPGLEFRGDILSTAHQHIALAVTQTKAYVWDYTAHTMANNAKVFGLPVPAKDGDPLPFGVLVPVAATQSDVGLLLVSATSGRIVYYESVERAASLGFLHEHATGVEGTISGFSYSEKVTAIHPTEQFGFMILLSSGRIIHLTLHDPQGKPKIICNVQRPGGQLPGGVLGSLRGMLPQFKKEVFEVRTRRSGREQLQVLAITRDLELLVWELDWVGTQRWSFSKDLKPFIEDEMKYRMGRDSVPRPETLKLVDFTLQDKSSTLATWETSYSDMPVTMLLLVSMERWDGLDYFVAEVGNDTGRDSGPNCGPPKFGQLIQISGYHSSPGATKPRLLLPAPRHTAIVVFPDAVALLSTMSLNGHDDPNAQLHDVSYVEPQPFEDLLYLRSPRPSKFLGACPEERRAGHESAIAFVQGTGLVRLSITDPSGAGERESLSEEARIEQAIFFGAMRENIFDFSSHADRKYHTEQTEEAVLAISSEILQSKIPQLHGQSSMSSHLEYRARALEGLVKHVRQNYPKVSKRVMWQLFWDAEKVAVGQALWSTYEKQRDALPSNDKFQHTTFTEEVCSSLESSELKTGDEDAVRYFFVNDLARTDRFLITIRQKLRRLQALKSSATVATLMYFADANELWKVAFDAIFDFREKDSPNYSIWRDREGGGSARYLDYAVLEDEADYEGIPEPWTCTNEMLAAGSSVSRITHAVAKDFCARYCSPQTPEEAVVSKIGNINANVIQGCCDLFRERIAWQSQQPSPDTQALVEQLQTKFETERYNQSTGLALIGKAGEGMSLAERFRDMHTLTELMVGEMQVHMHAQQDKTLPDADREDASQALDKLTARAGKYFTKFGSDWSDAFFHVALSGKNAGQMLEKAQAFWEGPLTTYLRADRFRVKMCWINDVRAVHDFRHAGQSLERAALDCETRLWPKKVELSLAKLALLADPDYEADHSTAILRQKRELELVQLQEQLFSRLQNEIASTADHQKKVRQLMRKIGAKATKDYSSLQQLLETTLSRLLDQQALSVDELIDIATLMDSQGDSPEGGFVLALKALNSAAPNLSHKRFETLLQLIWKRCYVRDDWITISHSKTTRGKTDRDMQLRLRDTVPWHILYTLHRDDSLMQPSCSIRVLAPSDCLGTACSVDDLGYRWRGNDDLLYPILHDNKVMDEVLQGYVTDRGLDQWIVSANLDAKAEV
ncbi:hypothetical protein K470DRAFT_202326, partial [Piedraia hortae CBS 480.64]